MSRLHVLEGAGGVYRIVVHNATPAGNNSAGVAWSAALINSGNNTTTMVTGTGPGQITSAEAGQIAAGTVIEGVFTFTDNPAWTAAQRNAALDAMATQTINETLARLADQLKWFGAVRT